MNSALDLTLTGLDLRPFSLCGAVDRSDDLSRQARHEGSHCLRGRTGTRSAQAAADAGISVADLATRDNFLNEDLVSWRSLQIDGMRYQMAPDGLRIERITVGAPYGRVVIGPRAG